MATTLRDYTKIKVENCELITQFGHGRKEFHEIHSITTTTTDDVVMVDYTNKEVVVFDKNLKWIRTFSQGSGDSSLKNPSGLAVSYIVIAVSECDDRVVKKFTLHGNYLSKFGSSGRGDGQFN